MKRRLHLAGIGIDRQARSIGVTALSPSGWLAEIAESGQIRAESKRLPAQVPPRHLAMVEHPNRPTCNDNAVNARHGLRSVHKVMPAGKIPMRTLSRWLAIIGLSLSAVTAEAADFPTPRETDWFAPGFRFHTGDVMAALRLHYTTIGDPGKPAVLILHGTGQSGTAMLTPSFAGPLFGPGQPLDATQYFIILPDALGAGRSAKPSDGMRTQFPAYNYDDMVLAQYRLVTEGLHIQHLRLVLGNSMGGMHTWLWGVTYPTVMDALVPMASQPTEMASRNWMTRRLLIETIRQDPAYRDGNYTAQPPSLRLANVFMGIATSGGTLAYQAAAPTRDAADRLVDERLAAPPPADANDYIYQWNASRDYNPAPQLDKVTAPVLAINSADDERNPPETGVMLNALRHVKSAHLLLIPASAETHGHGTTSFAKLWQQQLREFLATVPRPPM
jgi:homoserine O-acetyltransferase/O-succinyltransferase